MDRVPPLCRCGARAARAEISANPTNPQCHLCRVVAVDHPDWSDDQVAEGGAAWWRDIDARREAHRASGAPAAGATLAAAGRTHTHDEDSE